GLHVTEDEKDPLIPLQNRRRCSLLKIPIRLLAAYRLMHHIFYHVAAEFICLAGGQHTDAPCGQRNRINFLKPSALNFHIKAEPVTAVEASCGVEADRSSNGAFKIFACNGQNAFANVLCPDVTANQRI